MKILLVVVGLFVAAGAGAAGAALFAPAPAQVTASAVGPARVEPSNPGVPAEVDRRIASLSMEVADLQAQIRDLKSAAARSAVTPEAAAPTVEVASVPVAAVQRQQILQVLADEKAAEERRREEERLKREEQQRLQRADRAAQRYGLNEAQERQLVDFYAASEARLGEMRESMRVAREGGAFDGEQMRTAMRDTRDWANSELERLYGPDLGKQIAEGEMERFRGGFDGGGGGQRRGGQGGGQGGGGQGGGNAGGPGGTGGG